MTNRWLDKLIGIRRGIRKHQKLIFTVSIFAFIGSVFLFFPHAARAEELGDIFTIGYWARLLATLMLALSRLCISLSLFILTFIIELAGYNGFLDATAVTVGWVMIRDITNMVFVVALLLIAFGTILGIENYEWKHMLSKLVMAAILVNFSRTICGLLIDVAQVVMITFVNGIAATAGGNLIRAFNLDKIRDLSASVTPESFTDINFFLAGVAALTFSSMVMVMLGAFLFMLVARMLVLWVLIVLSPLAFVFSVLHQTEEYAHEWWHQFGSNVITGPVLLFFIWLAFVTVGNGRIHDEISAASSVPTKISTATTVEQSSGIGDAMTWNNMANFVIALGMLVVGAHAASQLGGIGGEWAGQAVDVGKKVATYASGVAAARWSFENGVVPAAKWTAKTALMKTPLVGGESWIRKGKWIAGNAQLGYYGVQKWRNEKAKDLGKKGKAYRDAEVDLRNKKITQAEFDKKVGVEGLGGVTGFMKRFSGDILEKGIETGARADKRAEDYMKAAEASKEAYEGDFSASNFKGGQLKYKYGVEAELMEERSHAKTERKKMDIRSGLYKGAIEEFYLDKGDIKESSPERRGKSLIYGGLSANAQEHAAQTEQEKDKKQAEYVLAESKSGHKLHKRAETATMEAAAYGNYLETHTQKLKAGLLGEEVGQQYVASRAAFDAQSNTYRSAETQMVEGESASRKSQALDEVKAEVDKRVQSDPELAKIAKASEDAIAQITAEALEKLNKEIKGFQESVGNSPQDQAKLDKFSATMKQEINARRDAAIKQNPAVSKLQEVLQQVTKKVTGEMSADRPELVDQPKGVSAMIGNREFSSAAKDLAKALNLELPQLIEALKSTAGRAKIQEDVNRINPSAFSIMGKDMESREMLDYLQKIANNLEGVTASQTAEFVKGNNNSEPTKKA